MATVTTLGPPAERGPTQLELEPVRRGVSDSLAGGGPGRPGGSESELPRPTGIRPAAAAGPRRPGPEVGGPPQPASGVRVIIVMIGHHRVMITEPVTGPGTGLRQIQ